MKHQKDSIQNKTILIMTVIIALLTIILVGISLNRGPLMDFNIIGASVSVLSIAVALVIGYQIINVLEIKSGMKNQNERIEKKHEEIQTVLDSKTREVDARMEVIRKELKAQKNQVDEQLQSIAKQEIVINQLLAKRSINKPYEYWQGMSYQVDAIKTAMSFNMIKSIELCNELFEYAFGADALAWQSENTNYKVKIDSLRKQVEETPNKPFLFLLDIVDEAMHLAKKCYAIDLKLIDEEDKNELEKKFNETSSIVQAGWQFLKEKEAPDSVMNTSSEIG